MTLIGIEADAGHIGFAKQVCTTMASARSRAICIASITAAERGTALFPKQNVPGHHSGLQPVFGATNAQRANAAVGSHDQLTMVVLQDIAGAHQRVDLLHIDIQRGEVDLIDRA